ncbi:MAG: serine hydrolase domain-containing protein, partial [Ignavibacteria bacterium]
MKISAAFFAVWLLPVSYSLCQAEESRIQIDLSRKLENYFEEISDTGFAFSVLVAVNGEVITQKGYGWIDPEKKKPASGKTVFNVASITKSFTAAGIFILQEKNLLSINNSLSKFFPDIPEDKKAITIVQLMAHSTGLGQNYLSDRV